MDEQSPGVDELATLREYRAHALMLEQKKAARRREILRVAIGVTIVAAIVALGALSVWHFAARPPQIIGGPQDIGLPAPIDPFWSVQLDKVPYDEATIRLLDGRGALRAQFTFNDLAAIMRLYQSGALLRAVNAEAEREQRALTKKK